MAKPQALLRSLFLGGVLPVVAFALVENYYGTMGGLIAGITFGIGELTYEYVRFRKIQGITIVGNLLVIVLGGLSLFENNPVFFKLQPAFLIFAFAGLLIGSSLLKKPFLVEMSRKQMPDAPEVVRQRLSGLNLRLGFCMIGIGLLSVYAAYFWSTPAWALLKGVGVPVILVVYMLIEVVVIRLLAKRPVRDKALVMDPSLPPK
jgi:intracellular septation protein